MKFPNLGNSRGQYAASRKQLIPSNGRHLDSPFGFLEIQPVPDFGEVHQELVRVANENSLLRQKKYRDITAGQEQQDYIRVRETAGETKSLCTQLKKIEVIASGKGMVSGSNFKELSKKKNAGSNDFKKVQDRISGSVPNNGGSHTQFPNLDLTSRGSNRSTYLKAPSFRSPMPAPNVQKDSCQNCFWCRRNAGRWCGWCQRPQRINVPQHDIFVGSGADFPVPSRPLRRHSSQRRSSGLEQQAQAIRSSTSLDGPIHARSPLSNATQDLPSRQPETVSPHASKDAQAALHIALLRRCKSVSLALLGEKQIGLIATHVRTLPFARGEVVFRQGDPAAVHREVRYDPDSETGAKSVVMAPPFYVVAKGVLHVTVTYGARGEEEGEGWGDPIATLNAGSVAGEHSALAGGTRRCTIRAAVPCMLVEVMRSHVSRALHDSLQDEADDGEEERERARRARRAARLLPMRAELAAHAARAREAVSEEFVRAVERRVFGSPLGEVQRTREWSTGVHARRMRREHEHLMAEHFATQIQRALAGMRARRVLQSIRRARAARLAAVIRIQRMFRGIVERRRMREKLQLLSAASGLATAPPGGAAAWTLQWLGQVREGREEAELDLHEAAAVAQLYGPIAERARRRRLDQAQRIVRAVLDGGLVGLVFRQVCEDVGGGMVPAKAIERWARGQPVVQRRRAAETDSEWEQRRERLEAAVREAALEWLGRTGLALALVADWRGDATGYRQSDAQLSSEKSMRRHYFQPGAAVDAFEQ
jgi:CRP-like cAMP-binding protein